LLPCLGSHELQKITIAKNNILFIMYLLFKNAKLLILKRRLNDKNHIEIKLGQTIKKVRQSLAGLIFIFELFYTKSALFR
ncbi:MAG: hypothetical protein KAK04_13085, partial [Cyclobacteriaceae bacterium]|nr:hypothetical protein [Cyclobacteriaceae bacterium]